MDDNKLATGLVIHGFAVAHAVTAGMLAQTVVGDEAALTALTSAMIIIIALMNGKSWTAAKALKFLGIFAGKYFGVRGAVFLIKLVPGIGNLANAATTFTVTEVLGWVTYMVVRDNKDFESLSATERDNLWKEAEQMQKTEKAESERLYNSMSAADRSEYDAAIKELRNKNISDARRKELTEKINRIARKYTS